MAQHGHVLSGPDCDSVVAYILAEAQIVDKTTMLEAQTLPRVQMPDRDGFIPDPRPELFR
jgi:cytochrome c